MANPFQLSDMKTRLSINAKEHLNHYPSHHTKPKGAFDLLTHYIYYKVVVIYLFSLYLICKHSALKDCVYKSDTNLMDVL